MINTAFYTVSNNQPLNHARILYAPISGTVTGNGTNPAYALNDYTSQRWKLPTGASYWQCTVPFGASVDCLFIAAHNLAGKTVTVKTADTVGGTPVARASFTPTDSSTICVLFNDRGFAYATKEFRLDIDDGSDVAIGIIRAGQALQMPIALYGGHKPLNLNRVTEGQQQFSETGQWLGRIIKRRAVQTTYEWDYLKADWYDATFEPFAKTLPLQPFCIAGNPLKITEDVGFVWTDKDLQPANMGVKAYRSVSLQVTGYY